MTEPATETTPTAAKVPPGDPADTKLGEGGLKALQSERDRATALEKLLNARTAELDTIKQGQLSELEKAQATAAAATKAAEQALTQAMRYKIAAKHGIDDTDAELFLTGSDESTMAKQAQRLLERTPSTPRPDPSQGSPGDLALNGDPLLAALKDKLGIT